MNAIETHALTRRFGAHTAVDGLDLTVRQGELFALLGVNGAGKTTTLRMLSGLLQPTGGEADILGFRLTQQPQEIKRRINLSPQETAVAPNLTVRENLELIAGIYGASRRAARGGDDRRVPSGRGRAQPGQNALRRLAAAAFHRHGADLAATARISG